MVCFWQFLWGTARKPSFELVSSPLCSFCIRQKFTKSNGRPNLNL